MTDKFEPVQTTPFTLKVKIKIYVWKTVNRTIFRLLPNYFRGYRRFLLCLFGAKLDKTVSINKRSNIDCPWNLTMGHHSSLDEGTWIYCLDEINIKSRCCIGKDVFLLTGSHDISSEDFSLITKKINIEDGVWLTTGVKVLPGVSIGEFSVAAVGAVVTKDVEPWTVVGGNPAKFIKKREIKN